MFMDIDFLTKFQWVAIVPSILALIVLSLGSIYLVFKRGVINRKVYRKKSSEKSPEAIIKRFKIMHDLGNISREQFESIKKDYS
jgi:hypothetical protein